MIEPDGSSDASSPCIAAIIFCAFSSHSIFSSKVRLIMCRSVSRCAPSQPPHCQSLFWVSLILFDFSSILQKFHVNQILLAPG
ncbi:MAG TPA: hypothetical protein VG733_16615, partial [Chthoniobacteraceae bacterium]|nr:hypothetical protein [Chthoniobacteraceae bacterium]